MTPSQTAELLTFCAAFDRRTIGKSDVLAWHTVLGNLDYEAARQAVTQHYATETRWIMPADIISKVRAKRRARLERHTESEPPPGDTRDDAYKAALLAERRAIADGRTEPRPVPALPPGETTQQPTSRARAILAAASHNIPSPRDGIVNVLTVPCPRCHAQPGRTCTTNNRRRPDPHPARLEDARRIAAGLPTIDRKEADQEMQRRREAAHTALNGLPQRPEPADDFDPIHRVKPNHQTDTKETATP